jgi:hypothetical protein
MRALGTDLGASCKRSRGPVDLLVPKRLLQEPPTATKTREGYELNVYERDVLILLKLVRFTYDHNFHKPFELFTHSKT